MNRDGDDAMEAQKDRQQDRPTDCSMSPRRLLGRAAARPTYARTLRDLNPALLAGLPRRQGILGRLRSWAAGLAGGEDDRATAPARRRRRR